MEIKEYHDLLDASELSLIWEGNKYIEAEYVDPSAFDGVMAFNFILDDIDCQKKYHLDMYDSYAIWFYEFCKIVGKKCYCMRLDNFYPKNKLRSYKGLYYKSPLDKMDFLELEFDRSDGYSVFLSIVEINSHSWAYMQGYIFSSHQQSIVFTNRDIFNYEFLGDVYSFIQHIGSDDDYNYMDYSKLLSLCAYGDIIFRTRSGNGAHVNCQVYCNQLDRDYVLSVMQKSMCWE